MIHHSADELARFRADLPEHWFIEVVHADEAILVAVPATKENANRVLHGSPGLTPDMLDGCSVRVTLGEPHVQIVHDR